MTDTTGPTSAADWKKGSGGIGQSFDVQVPSGNTARCRRPGLDVFLKLGLVPNSLMAIIQRQISKAQLGREPDPQALTEELKTIMNDPVRMSDMLLFVDRVVVHVCVEPKVSMTPDEGLDRDSDTLYADEVGIEDRMFLFQWAMGGTESLENFRLELAESVGALSDVQDVELPTE